MAVSFPIRLVVASVALCCAMAPAPATAQVGPPTSTTTNPTKEAKEEAQRRFEQGKELYEENDFRGALIEFRRAYQLAPNYKLLYTIAQVYYQLQDYASSLQTFEKYLADGGREVTAARKAEVEKEIERLKTRVAKVDISTNVPGATISIDDVEVGTTPFSKPVMVSAGRRKVTASLKGKTPVTRMLDLAGGDTSRLAIELQAGDDSQAGREGNEAKPGGASSVNPIHPEPEKPASTGKFPWIAWGVTGLFAVGTTITGVLALSASKDLASKRDTPNVGSDTLEDARSKTSTLALTTDILGAATLVAGGVSLYLTLKKGESAPASGTVQLGFAPGTVQVLGRF
ncbi:MAG: PEGA domain-containing protein [Deltaproteobacteria bacterium]|nr:PEGA domain-containing protein [Deltaproteobacteria bacterium]